MRNGVFRTSFGRNIPFVPGYFDAHRQGYLADPGMLFHDWPRDRRMDFWGFSKDVFEYSMMVDFLDRLGVSTRWQRLMDLGGAEGTRARLFRGQGKAERVTVIEANDQEFSRPDDLFATLLEDFRGVIRGGLSDARSRARGVATLPRPLIGPVLPFTWGRGGVSDAAMTVGP